MLKKEISPNTNKNPAKSTPVEGDNSGYSGDNEELSNMLNDLSDLQIGELIEIVDLDEY